MVEKTTGSLGPLAEALRALGALLEAGGTSEYLVVVGGVAMNLRGFTTRATTDVDVIARGKPAPGGTPMLVTPEPMPAALEAAVRRVARDFRLADNWLNTVVAKQWHAGMPPGLAEDLEWYRFGALHVGVPGREAMIALKLFAALDCGPRSVHMQDLLRLRPTDKELAGAAEWVRTHDMGEIFQMQIPEAVNYVHEHQDRAS